MSSVYDLHVRSSSLASRTPTDASAPPPMLGAPRAGETSVERRLRLLRVVLGDLREGLGA